MGQIDTVAPAHDSALAAFTILPTLLAAFVGSTTTVASSEPPKPVNTGAVASSKLTIVVLATVTAVS